MLHAAVESGGGPPPPLVGCFTFGEQGPLASESESCHANLMLNVLVFGKAADEPSREPRRVEPRDLRALRDTPSSSSSSSSEPRELRALRGSSPARAPRTPASTGGPGPGALP